MAKNERYLTFEGQYECDVLGEFPIIRGFANLKDLAEISVPYVMEGDGSCAQVKGQQREINSQHAERIKRYLEKGERRFMPEVILSVRTELTEERDKALSPVWVRTTNRENGIDIRRRWRIETSHVHRVTVDRKKLADIKEKKLIRRVDGNHRLALANTLQDDPHLHKKYLASFCMLLLGPAGEAADDYSESLIFHTINSTALPLESEHALQLILGQHAEYDMKPEKEFAFSPDLHFTRLLRDGLLKLPEAAQARLGKRPLTSLNCAARALLDMDVGIAKDLPTLGKYSKDLVAALDDIVTRLEPNQPALCRAEFFIELAARAWKTTPETDNHNARVNAAVEYLEQLAAWLGKDGLVELKEGWSLSKQVIDIFAAVRARVPKRVFLARWYPTAKDGEALKNANLRLKQVKQALKELKDGGMELKLEDMGTKEGSTFPIHPKMYDAIASSDIILIDLTGVRPNVCIEAGYALRHHEKDRLLFMFQQTTEQKDVPFDLTTYTYLPFTDTGEIPEKIKPHLATILSNAAVGA